MNSYLNFEQGEISIYLAGDALANLTCSLEQAEAIRREKRMGMGGVLYINTSFTTRKFKSAWREIIGEDSALDSRLRGNDNERNIFKLSCGLGELLWHFNEMKRLIEKNNIRHIIINNWEYGFKDYRQKEEAIFRLHEFLNMDVSLLIYAQANPEKAWAGKIMHGGLGKLSGLAVAVIDLTKERTKVAEDFNENVNLDSRKINELGRVREESEVRSLKSEVGEEEIVAGGMEINENGQILSQANKKHLPMSNKNRKLLAEYEKLHGKAQKPGESYRDMFDRVVGRVIREKVLVET